MNSNNSTTVGTVIPPAKEQSFKCNVNGNVDPAPSPSLPAASATASATASAARASSAVKAQPSFWSSILSTSLSNSSSASPAPSALASASSDSDPSSVAEKLTLKWLQIEKRSRQNEEEKLSLSAKACGYDVSVHYEWEKVFEEKKDSDFISEKEKEIVRQLKSRVDEFASDMTNRQLVIFLLAKKWNIERTLELIKSYKKIRAENNLVAPIQLSQIPSSFLSQPYIFAPAFLHDSCRRPIIYLILRHYSPTVHPFSSQLCHGLYLLERCMDFLPIIYWRRGLVYIEDLSELPVWSLGGDAAQGMKILQNCLPLRVSKILFVNPGWVFRILLNFAKLFVKQAVLDRVQTLEKEELKYAVPEQTILKEWGGKLQLIKEEDLIYKENMQALPPLNV